MTDFEFQIESFMLYCSSKNLSKKTMASYEQSLKLFAKYLQKEFQIENVKKVQTGHIRRYIKNLRERGKYTTVIEEKNSHINIPKNRKDFGKNISDITIANYLRNIKVFFNYLKNIEGEIAKNPCEKIEKIEQQRKVKKTLTPDELKAVFDNFKSSTFHGYRNHIISKLLLDSGMRVGEKNSSSFFVVLC